MNAPAYPTGTAPKKRGCLFYGCLTVFVVGLVTALIVGAGGYFLYKKVNRMVDEYTATQPAEMPAVQMEDSVYEALSQRVDSFGTALKDGAVTDDLTLTSDELNALLNRNEAMQIGKGRIHVVMKDSEVSGQVSIPLDALADASGVSMFRGRYLNGTARLAVETQNGRIFVRLLGMEVNDQMVPAELIKAFEAVNLLEEAYKDPKAAEVLGKIGAVRVTDGKLLVSPAKGSGGG